MNRPLLWILGFICAVIVFLNISGIAENQNPLKDTTDENIEISGIVDSIPVLSEQKTTFVFKLNAINGLPLSEYTIFQPKVQVTCSGKPSITISAGDLLNLNGTLSLADEKRNPGGFNYALYLRGKGIDGLFYTKNPNKNIIRGKSHHWKYKILKIRTKLSEICEQYFTNEQSDIIKGMLFGDKDISDDLQEQFSNAGISHLLSVSGLHVGYICIIITWIASLFKCGPRMKLMLLLPGLFFYCVITGCSASVIRAAIMTSIPLAGNIFHRHYDALSGLCFPAIIILLIWPSQLFSAGFQLSFGAVAAIILLYRPLLYSVQKKWGVSGKFYENFFLTFCATVGTLPVVLFHYHTLNLVSLISNLIMVPLAGVCMILILICLPLMVIISPLAGFLAFFPSTFSQLMIDLSGIFASLPGLQFNGPFPGFLECTVLIIGVFALCGYFNLRHRQHRQFLAISLSGLMVLIMVFSLWAKPLTITFLDVGQGDCTLIETPKGGVYLIDGGGYEGYRAKEKALENPISEKVLLPALYAKGITHIDGVFITHNHSDHTQGIEELLTQIPVDRIYLSTKYNGYALLKQTLIPVNILSSGMNLTTKDGCTLQVLWPDSKQEILPDDEQNDASMVIRIGYGQRSFLFTGDTGIETEEKLNDVSADVIKIGHHGSAYSTSASFLSRVSPVIAVISVGKYNTYGHPAQRVLNTISSQKTSCYRTDQNGAIVIKTNGDNLNIHAYIK